MARYFSETGDCRLGPEADVWQVLEAVDSYARAQTEGPVMLRASDARGWVEQDSYLDLRRECEEHGAQVTSIVMWYGERDSPDLSVTVQASELHLPTDHPLAPRVHVSVRGSDAARVRGIVAETVDRAKAAQPETGPGEASSGASGDGGTQRRAYSAREQVDIDAERAWVVLELADAAARAAIEGDVKSDVTVTDDRGEFQRTGVHAARVQWERDRRPVQRMRISYRSTKKIVTEPSVYIDHLDASYRAPNLHVRVTSTNFEEAERLAKQIVAAAATNKDAQPPADDVPASEHNSSASTSTATTARTGPFVSASVTPKPTPKVWWKRLLAHQYSVQIIGGIIAGLVILVVTILLT